MHGCALPIDARTGIRALGILNGRVLWPIAGGSEPAPEAPPADPPAPEAPADPPADPSETDWKAEARKWEQRAKANVDKAKKLDELEAANQSELEKEQKAREAAEQRVQAATVRAVRAEVKALAADTFKDPEDAVLNLGDLARFVGDDGEIDEKAIAKDLADILKRKDHLAKPEPAPEPAPASRPGTPARPTETLRPGAAPTAPERPKTLADAIVAHYQN